MSVPKSVTRISKKGVTYTSSVDRASYTITELVRAALRDVGKFISRRSNEKAQKLPGMKKSRRVRGKSSAYQYWVRKKEGDLQVGIKHATWYGTQQELGEKNQPKRQFLRNTTYDNIQQIVEIESQYLSALEDEAKALNMIDEKDYTGGGEDD